jgi:rubrerythrin
MEHVGIRKGEKMSANTEDRIKALEVALNNEARERDFYLKHKERTINPLGKLMFASIASDEDEHYRRILELHKRLQKDGKWPETIPLRVKGTEVKAVIQKLVDSVDTSSKADMDDMKAVEIAIDFETKGERFYGDLAQSVENPIEKKFYELLSFIEREHRLSLQDTYEYFKDPAGWYRIKERHHIDGA